MENTFCKNLNQAKINYSRVYIMSGQLTIIFMKPHPHKATLYIPSP
jgi:hypothetical protein